MTGAFPRWSAKDDAYLKAMVSKGVIYRSIASDLGRGLAATRRRAAALGIARARAEKGERVSDGVSVNSHFEPRLYAALKEESEREGVSMAELVRRAVRDYIEAA